MEYTEFTSRIDKYSQTLESNPQSEEVLRRVRERHEQLFRRLHTSPNTYHNLRHAMEVYERLILLIQGRDKRQLKLKPETIILMGEAALRHDDTHIGHTYRQDREEEAEMSNEELAAYIAESELRELLDSKDIFTIRKLILSTSFGQNLLPQGDPRYRSYEPQKPAEMLLAFADAGGGAFYGWRYFIEESIRYTHESENTPGDLGEWIAGRKLFVENVIIPRLNSIRKYLKKELLTQLDTNIFDILNKLNHIDTPEQLTALQEELYGKDN